MQFSSVAEDLPGNYDPENRLRISFTCTSNGCGARNIKSFSHEAYNNGVVLIQCFKCKKRHLIADNLGIFGPERNVEELLESKGIQITKVTAKAKGKSSGPAAEGKSSAEGGPTTDADQAEATQGAAEGQEEECEEQPPKPIMVDGAGYTMLQDKQGTLEVLPTGLKATAQQTDPPPDSPASPSSSSAPSSS